MDLDLRSAVEASPLMMNIAEQGWALPHRTYFRFSDEQIKLLEDIFKEGERTGMKKSPEEVEILVRKKFKPDQYLTVDQIKRFFSRCSAKLEAGTLTMGSENDGNDLPGFDNIEPPNSAGDAASNVTDEPSRDDIRDETREILHGILDWNADESQNEPTE